MELACLGLNHRSAPVTIREKFAVGSTHLGEASHALRQELSFIKESVVISTCNRTEFYLAADNAEQALDELQVWLAQRLAADESFEQHFYRKQKIDAAQHLCEVASGLDSMMLGETEIFGQVKQAYQAALEVQSTGATLNKLFQRSFNIGKLIRTNTQIQKGATSIAATAVDLAEKIFGKLNRSRVVVVGAGETSRQTAQALLSRGASSVFVTNRSFDKAEELAQEMGGRAVKFDGWQSVLAGVDIVISSTSAPHPVILPHHIESVRRIRKFRPIFLIDIAVPRDIHPDCGLIEEAYLYDIDTLENLAASAREQRSLQIQECQQIIAQELLKSPLPGTNP